MPATTFARPVSYGPSSAADPNQGRRFGSAFWVSASLHGVLFGLLIGLTIVASEQKETPPQIFELVRGEGNAFDAKETPAGSESGKAEKSEVLEMPGIQSVPSWEPPAAPAEPEPALVAPVATVQPVPAPPEPATVAPVKAAETAPITPVPNFKKTIRSKIQTEQQKVARKIEEQRAAEARAAAEADKVSKKMTYAQHLAVQGGRANPSATRVPTAVGGDGGSSPRIDARGVKIGVLGGTGAGSQGAGGKALTSDGGATLDRYFAMLRQRLRDNHEKPGGLSDLLNAEVEFTVAANGTLSGVRITRSSGNAEFDQSVLETFARVRSVGPRPDGKSDSRKLTFRMKEVGA